MYGFTSRRLLCASLLFLSFASAKTGHAASDENSADMNKARVAQAFAAWQEGTGSPFELLAEGASWTIEGFSKSAGTYSPAQLRDLVTPFNAALAGRLVPTPPTLYGDGDTVIARFKASAPLKTGGIYENTYAWFMRFNDGKVEQVHAFLDLPAFEATFESN